MSFTGKSTFQLAMDPTMTHDLIRLAFHPFLLCVWFLKTLDFHQVQVHSFRWRSGPGSKYSLLCEPHDLCRNSSSSTLCCRGDTAVDDTQAWLGPSSTLYMDVHFIYFSPVTQYYSFDFSPSRAIL